MSPEVFKKSKHLFVVYPGGCGGNHLANMLSLCDEFKSSCGYEELLNEYKKTTDTLLMLGNSGIKAHFSESHLIENLQDVEYKRSLLAEVTDKVNIFIGHQQHYFTETKSTDPVTGFDDKIWIVFSFPSEGSIPYNRMIKSGYHPCHTKEYAWPYRTHHSNYYYHLANDNNGFYFDTEKFFTPDGSIYLREMVLTNFGVVLPKTADILHSMWYKWMEYVAIEREPYKYSL